MCLCMALPGVAAWWSLLLPGSLGSILCARCLMHDFGSTAAFWWLHDRQSAPSILSNDFKEGSMNHSCGRPAQVECLWPLHSVLTGIIGRKLWLQQGDQTCPQRPHLHAA